MHRFILDNKGKLFQKVKTIFEPGQSRVTYSEVLVTSLSSVEVVSASPVDAKYSVVNEEASQDTATGTGRTAIGATNARFTAISHQARFPHS